MDHSPGCCLTPHGMIDDVESADIAKVAGAVGPILVASLGFVAASAASRSRHARLRDSAELLKLLPEQSESRKLLEAHIERTITQMADDDEKQRSTFGIVLSLVFVVFAGWTWTLALDGSNWWSALAVPLTVFGVMGFTMDVQRAKRDERGRLVKS